MSRNFSRLFWISLFFLLSACAPRRVELPSIGGGNLRAALAEKRAVSDIEATFSIVFEKTDSEVRGDGALSIAKTGDLDLRVYSLGFLAMELTARDGVVRSSPRIDRNKSIILTEGLTDCIFWWNLEAYTTDEEGDALIIRNERRTVWIGKKTFLPTRQVVRLDDGRVLTVSYSDPVRENGLWYQSRIRIEFQRYAVSLAVKNLAARNPEEKPVAESCVYCSL